jgi:hypothetical protein
MAFLLRKKEVLLALVPIITTAIGPPREGADETQDRDDV